MAHYRSVRPLRELNLSGQSLLALRGDWRSLRMMSPIERLFERYVDVCPACPFASTWQVGASEHPCSHRGVGWFNLIPDFLLRRGEEPPVLDIAWKVLDGHASGPREKHGLKQADFYQMLAYGQRDLGGARARWRWCIRYIPGSIRTCRSSRLIRGRACGCCRLILSRGSCWCHGIGEPRKDGGQLRYRPGSRMRKSSGPARRSADVSADRHVPLDGIGALSAGRPPCQKL